jgi:hypothetical protein
VAARKAAIVPEEEEEPPVPVSADFPPSIPDDPGSVSTRTKMIMMLCVR